MINRIYNEDCRATMRRLKKNSIDLVVTSPPYFNAREYSQYDDFDDYLDTLSDVFSGLFRVLKPARLCAVNLSPVLIRRENRNEIGKRLPIPFYFVHMMCESGWEFVEDIIWRKPNPTVFNRNINFYLTRKPLAYVPNLVTEYIFIFRKSFKFSSKKRFKEGSLVQGNYEVTNVWKMTPEQHSKHPAPFPFQLPFNIVRFYSYEREVVYDPFGGSGTTAVAALELNRDWVISEIDKGYCKMAQRRLDNVTPLINFNEQE